MPREMSVACKTKALALTRSFAPSARLTAEEIPPPIEPADSICCNMTIGNTKAIPARGSRPSWPTYQVSAMVTSALAIMAKIFGKASRQMVGKIGAEVRAFCNRSNLFMLKGWRTFVQKRIHAFFLILCGKQRMEQAALKHHAIAQTAFKRTVDRYSVIDAREGVKNDDGTVDTSLFASAIADLNRSTIFKEKPDYDETLKDKCKQVTIKPIDVYGKEMGEQTQYVSVFDFNNFNNIQLGDKTEAFKPAMNLENMDAGQKAFIYSLSVLGLYFVFKALQK